jgi:hypothetical protein
VKHLEPHPLAGQTVKAEIRDQGGNAVVDYRIEDYWDRVVGQSWMDSAGNPAALVYAMRSAMAGLPLNDEVLYGKVGSFGHLVHVSELVEA